MQAPLPQPPPPTHTHTTSKHTYIRRTTHCTHTHFVFSCSINLSIVSGTSLEVQRVGMPTSLFTLQFKRIPPSNKHLQLKLTLALCVLGALSGFVSYLTHSCGGGLPVCNVSEQSLQPPNPQLLEVHPGPRWCSTEKGHYTVAIGNRATTTHGKGEPHDEVGHCPYTSFQPLSQTYIKGKPWPQEGLPVMV